MSTPSGLWPGKVVTEVEPVGPFWEAEPEHQDYLERTPTATPATSRGRTGSCRIGRLPDANGRRTTSTLRALKRWAPRAISGARNPIGRSAMGMAASEIEKRILQAPLPDAQVEIRDLAGDGDHYAATVISKSFRGKTRVQQHQMVNAAFGTDMGTTLHLPPVLQNQGTGIAVSS